MLVLIISIIITTAIILLVVLLINPYELLDQLDKKTEYPKEIKDDQTFILQLNSQHKEKGKKVC